MQKIFDNIIIFYRLIFPRNDIMEKKMASKFENISRQLND